MYIYIYKLYLTWISWSPCHRHPACAKLDSLNFSQNASAWSWHRCSLAVSNSSAIAVAATPTPGFPRSAWKAMEAMVKDGEEPMGTNRDSVISWDLTTLNADLMI